MVRDKRRSKRKIAENVQANCLASTKQFNASVKNISESGVCLASSENITPGETVNLFVRLFPKLPAVKYIESRVVWKNEDGSCGLKFGRMSPEVLELIRGYVNN